MLPLTGLANIPTGMVANDDLDRWKNLSNPTGKFAYALTAAIENVAEYLGLYSSVSPAHPKMRIRNQGERDRLPTVREPADAKAVNRDSVSS